MKNAKMIVLIIVSIMLVGALGYLTLLIQDSSNPLGMFNLRASNEEEEVDPFLTENELDEEPTTAPQTAGEAPDPIDNPETQGEEPTFAPSPTTTALAFNSTSPTLIPGGKGIVDTATPSATLTPTNTTTPTFTPIPTSIQKLPNSGITDHVDKILIGGGILILLGLLL